MWVEVFSVTRYTVEPRILALVGLGGAIGAMLRYGVGEWFSGEFPWGTLAVNLIGSLLLGVILGLSLSEEMVLVLGIGLMGAFTTMSAYSMDLVRLFDEGQHSQAATYLLITLLGCPLLAFAGWKAVSEVV